MFIFGRSAAIETGGLGGLGAPLLPGSGVWAGGGRIE